MVDEFGLIGRQQLTCGTHIHVSIEHRAEGVAVIDRIRPWLHVLVALSSNSPFWDGQDTGYASWRTILWGQWPSAGPVEIFDDEAGYDKTVSNLLATGTLLDDAMVYFDVRLSANYPTVEIRVADACTTVDDTVAIAALCRALVDTAAGEHAAGNPPQPLRIALLRAATWRAAKSGMTGDLVDLHALQPQPAWTVAGQLLTHVGPALTRNGDYQHVADTFDRLRTTGTGAERQRRAYARRSLLTDVLDDVVSRSHN
jgi:carboxylate-amine ligase